MVGSPGEARARARAEAKFQKQQKAAEEGAKATAKHEAQARAVDVNTARLTSLRLGKEAADKGIPVLAYGVFINTVIEFLIIAFCLFIVIKQANRFKKPAAAPAPTAQETLLTEIRDVLKSRSSV